MKYRTFARVDEDGKVELDSATMGEEEELVYEYSFEHSDEEWEDVQGEVGTGWFPVEVEL